MIIRVSPSLNEDNTAFWTGGSDGELRIAQCNECALYLHPPAPVCRRCRAMNVSYPAVPGTGRVAAFTVNRHLWNPGDDEPYVVAMGELDIQPDLRITTNIIGCPVDEVYIGMPVEVTFERVGEGWLPLFRPAASPAAAASVSEED